jgi:hypothetical protein
VCAGDSKKKAVCNDRWRESAGETYECFLDELLRAEALDARGLFAPPRKLARMELAGTMAKKHTEKP